MKAWEFHFGHHFVWNFVHNYCRGDYFRGSSKWTHPVYMYIFLPQPEWYSASKEKCFISWLCFYKLHSQGTILNIFNMINLFFFFFLMSHVSCKVAVIWLNTIHLPRPFLYICLVPLAKTDRKIHENPVGVKDFYK